MASVAANSMAACSATVAAVPAVASSGPSRSQVRRQKRRHTIQCLKTALAAVRSKSRTEADVEVKGIQASAGVGTEEKGIQASACSVKEKGIQASAGTNEKGIQASAGHENEERGIQASAGTDVKGIQASACSDNEEKGIQASAGTDEKGIQVSACSEEGIHGSAGTTKKGFQEGAGHENEETEVDIISISSTEELEEAANVSNALATAAGREQVLRRGVVVTRLVAAYEAACSKGLSGRT